MCITSLLRCSRAHISDHLITAHADAGVDPINFPAAPTIAIPKALKKAGLSIDEISLFEINEAFSVVVNIAEKVLNIPRSKINVNGGAVALGHAIGNSGSRIVVSLVHALQPGQHGVAGICNGVSPNSTSISRTRLIPDPAFTYRVEQLLL